MSEPEDWIAASGPRAVSDDAEDTTVPDAVLNDADLSLTAKGLYALALSNQGQPLNPYADAFEEVEDIRAAVDELIAARLVLRVQP